MKSNRCFEKDLRKYQKIRKFLKQDLRKHQGMIRKFQKQCWENYFKIDVNYFR